MMNTRTLTRPAKFKPFALLFLALPFSGGALALDVSVIGLFPGRGAVVVIDGAAPKSIKVGQKSSEGVLLISADKETALFEIEGKKKTLRIGQHHRSESAAPRGNTISLAADARGHFVAAGTINETSQLRMLVDTGASAVAIPEAEAQRMGLDYKKGATASISTANGVIPAWRVKLDSVKIGDVSTNNVDAVVMPGANLPIALLGMSFLNRFEMNRDGETMTLKKRF
jgi:aspartyl protease family protein